MASVVFLKPVKIACKPCAIGKRNCSGPPAPCDRCLKMGRECKFIVPSEVAEAVARGAGGGVAAAVRTGPPSMPPLPSAFYQCPQATPRHLPRVLFPWEAVRDRTGLDAPLTALRDACYALLPPPSAEEDSGSSSSSSSSSGDADGAAAAAAAAAAPAQPPALAPGEAHALALAELGRAAPAGTAAWCALVMRSPAAGAQVLAVCETPALRDMLGLRPEELQARALSRCAPPLLLRPDCVLPRCLAACGGFASGSSGGPVQLKAEFTGFYLQRSPEAGERVDRQLRDWHLRRLGSTGDAAQCERDRLHFCMQMEALDSDPGVMYTTLQAKEILSARVAPLRSSSGSSRGREAADPYAPIFMVGKLLPCHHTLEEMQVLSGKFVFDGSWRRSHALMSSPLQMPIMWHQHHQQQQQQHHQHHHQHQQQQQQQLLQPWQQQWQHSHSLGIDLFHSPEDADLDPASLLEVDGMDGMVMNAEELLGLA